MVSGGGGVAIPGKVPKPNPGLGLGERTSGLKWWVDTTAHLKVTLFLSVPKGTLQSLHVNPHLSINRSANQVSDQFSSSFLHQST